MSLFNLFSRGGLALLFFFAGSSFWVAADVPPSASAPVDGEADPALEHATAVIQVYPQNPAPYILRGNLFAQKELWDQARKDYEKALQLDAASVIARLNLAEIELRQKQYDPARADFVALKDDKNVGDLASYKVFLCDLFSAHEAAARQELDAFNAVGENASYYFGNVAWDLVHHDLQDAASYLQSAKNIYPPKKCRIYAANLLELGYLPVHVKAPTGT